jgi:hypothetical protein
MKEGKLRVGHLIVFAIVVSLVVIFSGYLSDVNDTNLTGRVVGGITGNVLIIDGIDVTQNAPDGSCQNEVSNSCGAGSEDGCWCDEDCGTFYYDCCSDVCDVCSSSGLSFCDEKKLGSCLDVGCGDNFDLSGCFCGYVCNFPDQGGYECCPDFDTYCKPELNDCCESLIDTIYLPGNDCGKTPITCQNVDGSISTCDLIGRYCPEGEECYYKGSGNSNNYVCIPEMCSDLLNT